MLRVLLLQHSYPRARPAALGHSTLVTLDSPYLERDGNHFRVSAGMLVSAEFNLGTSTVIEYLLSLVRKATHEAAREMQIRIKRRYGRTIPTVKTARHHSRKFRLSESGDAEVLVKTAS